MFGYNILSDLKNGELVTPIRMKNGVIVCLTQNGEEIECSFEDFDFEKTEEERLIEVDSNEIEKEPIVEKLVEEIKLVEKKEEANEEQVEKLEKFVIDEEEKIKILEFFNFKYDSNKLNKINILKSNII